VHLALNLTHGGNIVTIFLISSSKNALLDSTLKTESAADAQLVVLLGWWVGVEFNAPLDTI